MVVSNVLVLRVIAFYLRILFSLVDLRSECAGFYYFFVAELCDFLLFLLT